MGGKITNSSQSSKSVEAGLVPAQSTQEKQLIGGEFVGVGLVPTQLTRLGQSQSGGVHEAP